MHDNIFIPRSVPSGDIDIFYIDSREYKIISAPILDGKLLRYERRSWHDRLYRHAKDRLRRLSRRLLRPFRKWWWISMYERIVWAARKR